MFSLSALSFRWKVRSMHTQLEYWYAVARFPKGYLACKVCCGVIIVEQSVPNLFPRFRHFPTRHVFFQM